jgi:hypothetical protein
MGKAAEEASSREEACGLVAAGKKSLSGPAGGPQAFLNSGVVFFPRG